MKRIGLPHRLTGHGHRSKEGAAAANHDRTASPARGSLSDPKPLIVKVYVIRARNLAAKDKSGTSDPYLVVSLGNAKQSTPSISKNLNPEWKICLDLPLVGVPLLECTCWDKDRFGKDYMGEFDLAVEEIFADGNVQQEPQWYPLISKRKNGKKDADVSGEVQIQFSLVDSANPAASPEEISKRFRSVIQADEEAGAEDAHSLDSTTHDDDEIDSEDDTEIESITGDTNKDAKAKKKKKKLAKLRRRATIVKGYEFTGKDSDVTGMIFMEIVKATDLPPERNVTRTSFDVDPFIVTALGRKVLRTKVIRHNLNPVYNEKMVFQVLKYEMGYSLTFSVVDRDKLSGNDFIASTNFPVQKLVQSAPDADPNTGLYRLPEIHEYSPPASQSNGRSRLRLPLSRSSSQQSIPKMSRPSPKSNDSALSLKGGSETDESARTPAPTSAPQGYGFSRSNTDEYTSGAHDPDMLEYTIPMEMKNKERWEDKHAPELHIKARFMPYAALRQQFWRAMLKQYDADDSKRISKIELSTMLDTLGSTLHESTIDSFFQRFAGDNRDVSEGDMTFDQAVICLEEQLEKASQRKSMRTKFKEATGFAHVSTVSNTETDQSKPVHPGSDTAVSTNEDPTRTAVPAIQQTYLGKAGEEGQFLTDELADEGDGEEHVIEIRECPICHQPKLNKRTDADIITHIATCASSDWRQVNNLVMGGFVTQSQAQRKWYSKVITKISYGGYKLGANSANILVQDRITGQINEEKMSVYVRLGIRLLYKALGSREMEKKRIKKMLKSLSVKQGKKYDDPASTHQIEGFVAFHRLDMSEVLQPMTEFKSFNEFFYRALKPDARPCSAPNRPEIIVSPADCRTVVFNTIDDATRIWVKGRDFTLERLLGDAYPLDAKRYKGGSMGIFRLAPQDYHRFHVPVDGVIGTPKAIEGEYYTVNPMAIRSALDVYGENVRVVVPIDSVAHGRVMFVCIGAMMVGSTVITRKPGERVKRAEELGYFKFGGSTVLLFFEPGRMVYDDDLVENSNGALETLVRVGMSIGHSPGVGPHVPDMKKEPDQVTNEERQEAKRRIEGSLAPDRDAGMLEGLKAKHIQ